MAILVNTNRRYPPVAENLVSGPAPDAFAHLERVTAGDWPPMSEGLLGDWADVLIGSAQNTVTVVYRIVGWRLVAAQRQEKLRFEVESAPEFTGIIGGPVPGGPWAKGEARGTRRVPTPRVSHRDPGRTWRAAVVATARALFPGAAATRVRQSPAPLLTVADVQLRVRPEGTLVVEVPDGVAVLVQPRQKHEPPAVLRVLRDLAAHPPQGEEFTAPQREPDRPLPW